MKVIKTKDEHEAALVQIDALLDLDPALGTREAEELELLSLLVEQFERDNWSIDLPDPIDAIMFRMEQQGLRQRDLVPYIGSRGRVSEVLGGKRSLTLPMIRALHEGLKIPADVLLNERDARLIEKPDLDWNEFPLGEMIKRGWINTTGSYAADHAEELLTDFFGAIGGVQACAALYRRARHVRSAARMNRFALVAWTAQVLRRAYEHPASASFEQGSVNIEFLRAVARLSWSDQGPVLAQEFLGKHGIKVVIEPHLKQTYLDGAALFSEQLNAPVIGLTLRHDRLDNFWFCLMHELAHIALHLDADSQESNTKVFYDDLDANASDSSEEMEADKMASGALIPEAAWNKSPARTIHSPEAVELLAKQLGISKAIVAGRIRSTTKRFQLLSNMIGQGDVRALFPDVGW